MRQIILDAVKALTPQIAYAHLVHDVRTTKYPTHPEPLSHNELYQSTFGELSAELRASRANLSAGRGRGLSHPSRR